MGHIAKRNSSARNILEHRHDSRTIPPNFFIHNMAQYDLGLCRMESSKWEFPGRNGKILERYIFGEEKGRNEKRKCKSEKEEHIEYCFFPAPRNVLEHSYRVSNSQTYNSSFKKS